MIFVRAAALAGLLLAAPAWVPASAQAPRIGENPAVVAHLPGIGAQDHRQPVDADAPPWRGLARVRTELGGSCTGFLVAPDRVLTAGHCLYRPITHGWLQPGSVHVQLGYQLGNFVAHARVVAYRVGPGFDPAHESATAGADWALLTLERPIDAAGRILSGGPPEARLMLAGYGQDRVERLLADTDCHLTGQRRDGGGRRLLAHDCAATAGTSGAPLLALAADGSWVVIGIQIAANRDGTGGLAVPLPAP